VGGNLGAAHGSKGAVSDAVVASVAETLALPSTSVRGSHLLTFADHDVVQVTALLTALLAALYRGPRRGAAAADGAAGHGLTALWTALSTALSLSLSISCS
jgi:hypothetical protein